MAELSAAETLIHGGLRGNEIQLFTTEQHRSSDFRRFFWFSLPLRGYP
jgi:hypothetical protein